MRTSTTVLTLDLVNLLSYIVNFSLGRQKLKTKTVNDRIIV